MKLITALLIAVSFIPPAAQAVSLQFGEELAPCFSLPEYAEGAQ
ncbi:hypothetical protein [Cronobacter dublinensis]|nr:hypothetical protein [Cronobacter dublinensis]